MKHANIGIFIPHLACNHSCVFCNQVKISGHESVPSPDEVSRCLKSAVSRLEGRTAEIAFFGGSFTGLDTDTMTEYLKAAYPFIDGKTVTGIRLSTRPDYINNEILSILKRYGVTDIELGAQSMDDGVLSLSARGHSAADTERSSRLIKENGFRLVLQFMPGLPGDSPEKTLATAEKIASLCPDGVRIYPTVVIRGTKLASLYESGEFTPYSLETAVSLSAKMYELFSKKGISVLRMGLHSDIKAEDIVAGPFHPAFGELVYSEIYKNRFDEAMMGKNIKNPVFRVKKNELSMALGQKKKNVSYIEDKYGILSEIICDDERSVYSDAIAIPSIH
ncbi:MAG: radical SAM protein [Clostridia bacterium]|nr:radical SAM protein [Clostridia bacterium]